MKFARAIPPLVLALSVLGLPSCREEAEPAEPAETSVAEAVAEPEAAALAEPVAEEVEEVVELEPGDRAAMLGFAAHLDADVEGLLALYDGAGLAGFLEGLKFWELVNGVRNDAGIDAMVPQGPALAASLGALFGEELVIAWGEGSAEQIEVWNQLGGRMNYYQARVWAEFLLPSDISGGLGSILENEAWLAEMLQDAPEFLPLFEEWRLSPLLVAVRQADADARRATIGQIQDLMAMVGGMAEPVTIERGGAKLEGMHLQGEALVGLLAADPSSLDEAVGRETREALLKILSEKSLVFAAGELGDSLVFFLGDDPEDCPLAEDLASSIVAGDELSFVDAERGKPLHALSFAREELIEAMDYAALKDSAEGLRDGISALGEVREISAMLDLVVEKEAALRALHEAGDFGGLLVLEDGLRFEGYGGLDNGMLDREAPHRLPMPEGPALVSGGWVADEEAGERAADLGAALVESLYAIASRRAAAGGEQAAGFSAALAMFDETFRDDVVALLGGLRVSGEGLGGERLFVIEAAGELPPLPGVPSALIGKAKSLRLGLAAPVLDRKMVAEGWSSTGPALRSLSEALRDQDVIPWALSDPTSSERDGVVTWYYDALSISDDAKPSVTLSDDLMVLSSSRDLALRMASAPGRPASAGGAWMKIDLEVLRTWLSETLELMAGNPAETIPDESARREFEASLPELREWLEALGEFEAVDMRDRVVDGRLRGTFHLRTR